FVHGRDLAADFGFGTGGRLASCVDGVTDLAADRTQIDAGAIGGERHLPLHVVAVVLAGHRSGANFGDVADENLSAAFALQRNLSQVFGRVNGMHSVHGADDGPRDFDLHLVRNTSFWVGPIVG